MGLSLPLCLGQRGRQGWHRDNQVVMKGFLFYSGRPREGKGLILQEERFLSSLSHDGCGYCVGRPLQDYMI